MGKLTSVCVYCGSATGVDPIHAEAARILGEAMAKAGVRLVYGGGSIGLMGILARSVLIAASRSESSRAFSRCARC
jgi:predicted Rossmann-fold nucleotide-binding protein